MPNKSKRDQREGGIEDFLLPRSVIARIAKESLSDNSPLPKDGVTALMRGATMFISYITAHASDIARAEFRKTVTHLDILKALSVCNFEVFVNATKDLVEEQAAAKAAQPDEVNEEDEIEEDVEPEDPKRAGETKRIRMESVETSSDHEMEVDE